MCVCAVRMEMKQKTESVQFEETQTGFSTKDAYGALFRSVAEVVCLYVCVHVRVCLYCMSVCACSSVYVRIRLFVWMKVYMCTSV